MGYAPPAGEQEDLTSLHLHDRHSELGLGADDLVGMYRLVLLSRKLDQRIWALNRQGRAAFVVSAQGHEGAQVGCGWALRGGGDTVCPYYRDTALMLTLGMTPTEVLLGVFAKASDPSSGGRQMPNHWGSSRLGVFTGSSPIATQIPHAAGAAYAAMLRGDDTVAAAFFGDGAASEGDFHEAMNFAGIHRLPLVAVCENNLYAISTPLAKESATEHIAHYAHVYGFTGVIVDGNDPIDVYAAMHRALRRARAGEGPTLIEAKTYRYLAHTSDDDDRSYRAPEEVEAWRKKDPLQRLKQYLIEQRLLPEGLEAEIEAEIEAEVARAVEEAEGAPDPEPADAFRRVYARPLRPIPGVPEEFASTQDGAAPARHPEPDLAGAPELNVIETVRTTLLQAMAADDRVLLMGEDVGARGGVFKATEGLLDAFGPQRVLDTPLAESAIVGVAIGAALAGMRPVAEIQFADFIAPAWDQIVSEAARIHYRSNGDFHVPLVVRAPYGGGVHGALYHSQSVESSFAHIPGLKVVCPATPSDMKGLLLEALDDPDPVIVFEHKRTYRAVKGPVPEGDYRVPIGVARVARVGTDLTIVTYGLMVHHALEVAEELSAAGEGEVEVVDLRTVKPLDTETVVASVAKTGRALVVAEDNWSVSVASEVCAVIAQEAFFDLDAPVSRLCTADIPAFPFHKAMEDAALIGPERIRAAAEHLLRL
jgi:2-oxoisovalerate dehydrogenase E1 component